MLRLARSEDGLGEGIISTSSAELTGHLNFRERQSTQKMRKGRRCAFGCRQGAISIWNYCSVCTCTCMEDASNLAAARVPESGRQRPNKQKRRGNVDVSFPIISRAEKLRCPTPGAHGAASHHRQLCTKRVVAVRTYPGHLERPPQHDSCSRGLGAREAARRWRADRRSSSRDSLDGSRGLVRSFRLCTEWSVRVSLSSVQFCIGHASRLACQGGGRSPGPDNVESSTTSRVAAVPAVVGARGEKGNVPGELSKYLQAGPASG